MESASPLSVPLIFWNKRSTDIQHNITAMAVSINRVATGSATGDIVMWKLNDRKCEPQVIATPSIDLECRHLAFITPPFRSALRVEQWVASLHDDSRLRLWDWEDGRCVSVSAASLLAPIGRAKTMCHVQHRLLVVAGEEPELLVVDAWELSLLSSLHLPDAVIDICCATNFSLSSRLLALTSESQIYCWEFPDISDYLLHPQNSRAINTHPRVKLTMRTSETPHKIAVSTDGSLLAVAYECIISFIHESWFTAESRDEAYMCMSSAVSKMTFTEESLVVVLADGLLAEYDIDDTLKAIGVGSGPMNKTLTRRNTLGAVFSVTDKPLLGKVPLKDVIKPKAIGDSRRTRRFNTMKPYDLVPHPQVTSLGVEARCLAFNEDYFFLTKQGCIYVCDLDSILKRDAFDVSYFSLLACKPKFMADSQLHYLLSAGEIVTDAHMVMAHAWPLYVVGTSQGRVFVVPLAAAYAIRCLESGIPDPITCLLFYRNLLVSCASGGTVQCWSLSMQDLKAQSSSSTHSSDSGQLINTSPQFPVKTFTIPYPKVIGLKQPHYVHEVLESVPESQWRDKWSYWQNILIGQLEDETVILLSMERKQVDCAFYGLRGGVKEAHVHLLLNYLFLNCGDGDCYIVNMSTEQLERIVPSVDFPYQTFHHTNKLPDLTSIQSEDFAHRVLEFSLSGLSVQHSQALAWVEYPTLGKSQFPVLCLNVGRIEESFREMTEFPEQAEFIISLLNSWVKSDDPTEIQFQEQLQKLFGVHDPSVVANIGVLSIENCMSFRLPTSSSRWQVSSYISAMLSTALLTVLSSCVQFKPSLKQMLSESIDSHVERLSRRLKHFRRPSPAVLGYEVLDGNVVAYQLLRSTLAAYSDGDRRDMTEDWEFLYGSAVPRFEVDAGLESPCSPSSIHTWRPPIPVKLISHAEALSVLLLCCLHLAGAKCQSLPSFVPTLFSMLRNANSGYVLTAALLLHDGIKKWKHTVEKDLLVDIARCLLKLHHVGGLSVRSWAKKAALSVGKADVHSFCDVLKHEVVKVAGSRDYPESVLTILESFVHKHAAHILTALPTVMDVVLRSLDPREILLRKICLSKATDVLEVMVKVLPMVAFDHNRQLLALGTSDSRILVYDLKTATLWRDLKGHAGPVNAVCFSPGGNQMASYCIADAALKMWKIEPGFLGFGSLQATECKSSTLPQTVPQVRSSQDLLNTIKIAWEEDCVQLTREDGVAYSFRS